MRVDGATTPEPIHQMARGPTSPPMPNHAPEAGRHHHPMAAEMHGWAGSTRFVLRPTELASADALADEPWVGAATPWSRAVPKFLTTDRRGQRNPSRRELPWIPLSSPTSACRSGGGPFDHGAITMSDESPFFAVPLAAGCRNLPAPGVPEPATTRSPPGWAGKTPRKSSPATSRARRRRSKVLEVLIKLFNTQHTALENRLAQDAAGTRAVSAALLPRPEAEGGLQDGAGPARNLGQKHIHDGAGLAAGASGTGDDPDLPELPAGLAMWMGKHGFVRKPGHYGLSLEEYQRHESAQRDKSWTAQGIDAEAVIAEVCQFDLRVGASLRLMSALGLRRKSRCSSGHSSMSCRSARPGCQRTSSRRIGMHGSRARAAGCAGFPWTVRFIWRRWSLPKAWSTVATPTWAIRVGPEA